MEHLLALMAFISVAVIVVVLVSVRREHIRVEYSVSWLFAGVVLLILSRASGTLEWLAFMLRLGDARLALFAILFITFLIVFFRFTVMLSQLKDSNIAITQRVAILEYQLRSLNEKKQDA